ncbi:MAG: site-specific integrase [Bacteroidales bacterium]|nr:site-specific integrase [Bacteroidales bacterium]
MVTFNIELSSKPIKGQKEHLLMLRITVNRKKARIALMYSVLPNQFISKATNFKFIRASNPSYSVINSYLENQINTAKTVAQEILNEKKPLTAIEIKRRLLENKGTSFFEYAQNKASSFKAKGEVGSFKKYNAIISSLREFVGENTDLMFEEINVDFLNRYRAHLTKNAKAQTTIHGYFSKIRTIYNNALHDGLIEFGMSPFVNYKIKEGNPSKDRLSTTEINKIEELKLVEDTLMWHVQNAFLFSFYNAGIRISDILMMTWDNIKEDRLVYTMYKTNKTHSLKLKEKPLAILEKYKDRGESFIFPFFSDRYDYSDPLFLHNQIGSKTALINKYLKDIAKKAGINKKITTHTARHSFADIARQKTDNIYNLSKTLGHSSLKVTEAYLASFDEKAVDDTLDKVF